jgi:hypothetical protein
MTRYMETKARTVGEDGRIGYTWRFLPEEAKALDAIVAKSDYTDRTAWFREEVLGLPALVREKKEPKAKPAKAKKGKKAKAAPSAA